MLVTQLNRPSHLRRARRLRPSGVALADVHVEKDMLTK